MASPSDIKKGIVIRDLHGLWVVVEFQHVNPGKGAAFVRTRMKNIQTGKVLEVTFKTSESITLVEVEHTTMQYLYKDVSGYVFMDTGTYEQFALPEDAIGDQARYLREGLEVHMQVYEGQPIAMELPRKMNFRVIEASDAVAGNTASGGNMTKEVMLEGGLTVRVPLFIKQGELIVVNTDTGEYVERAKE